MSAMIVPTVMIDSMLEFLYRSNPMMLGNLGSADVYGSMLANRNLESWNHRYRKNETLDEPYRYKQPKIPLTAVECLKCIAFYEYQSFEDEFAENQFQNERQFLEIIKTVAINALPGYSEAPWGFGFDE
jgi:hypothetical protein